MYNVEEKRINELKLRAAEKTPFYKMNCDSYDICIYVRAQVKASLSLAHSLLLAAEI